MKNRLRRIRAASADNFDLQGKHMDSLLDLKILEYYGKASKNVEINHSYIVHEMKERGIYKQEVMR